MASAGDLKLYVESLYPGIRTEGDEPVELRADHDHRGVVSFTWLAEDSPISDLTKADLSKRGDVVFYAEISGDGNTNMTSLAVFKLGSSAVAVDDRRNLYLEVSGGDAGANMVALRARIQHVPRPSPTDSRLETPSTLAKNWPLETPPIRIRYGRSAEVQVTDQEHKTWKVSLHPDHLRGAIH
jgi:hypothetical protein